MCVSACMHVFPPTNVASPYKVVRIYKGSQVLFLKVPPEQWIKKCAEKSVPSTTVDIHTQYKEWEQKQKNETFHHKL